MLILLAIRRRGSSARERLRQALRVLVPAGMAVCAAPRRRSTSPTVRRLRNRGRSDREIQIYGASLVSYVTPPATTSDTGRSERWRRNENSLFAGFLPTLLALSARRSRLATPAPTPRPAALPPGDGSRRLGRSPRRFLGLDGRPW